ncbi:MAG: hypothetical protein LPK45_10670, partial [Bacteroidota bacterium]|nr:hypothetical protein [Bacteroidota bacterium]MDX5431562.1 hypothetical protein [Bacteroidota bacterium]MDX5470283.1 hypothetical protein [Bacteroidota bacterium]
IAKIEGSAASSLLSRAFFYLYPMNRKIHRLFLSIILMGCLSCGNGQERLNLDKDFQKVEVPGEFSIRLPNYLGEDTSLHEDAILAYQNEFREVAVIVLDEYQEDLRESLPMLDSYVDTASFIANYLLAQISMISESLEFPENSEPVLTINNGYPSAHAWVEGGMEDMDLAYYISCIEANEKVYFILCYTSQKKKTKFEDTFEKIGASFLASNVISD